MDRPDYLSDDDAFQGAVKAERSKILHANRNATQTPRSPSVSSVSGSVGTFQMRNPRMARAEAAAERARPSCFV